MNKHTPVAWEVDLNTYPIVVRSKIQTWQLVAELDFEEGLTGAFVANVGDNKANALLIAAAPDLLEALETLTEHFEYYVGDNECRPLENARAAIAKATGGEL